MFTEHAQVEGRLHIARQRADGFPQRLFLTRGFLALIFTLPGKEPEQADGNKQDCAVGQAGIEKGPR